MAGWAHLARATGLRKVSLPCRHGLLDGLAQLPQLQAIKLLESDGVTAAGLAQLQRLPALRSLQVHNWRTASEAEMEASLNLSNLTKLVLSCCKNLSDFSIYSLAQRLPDLEVLKLHHCSEFTHQRALRTCLLFFRCGL